jgi:hypothetical protein
MIGCGLPFTSPNLGARAFSSSRQFVLAVLLGIACFLTPSLWACSACYGQSDSPMAAGMNWGIMSLLAMIVVVLGGVAGFFIFLARRSAALAASNEGIPGVAASTAGAPLDCGEEPAWSTKPLAARGGLNRVSPSAHPRHRCAENRFTVPRKRS